MDIRYLWLADNRLSIPPRVFFTDRGYDPPDCCRWSKPEHLEQICRLMSQLTGREIEVTEERLLKLGGRRSHHILYAFDGDKIVGKAMLIELPTTLYDEAAIEDVVVDEDYRGSGIGRALMEGLIQHAARRNVGMIQLTSRPSRVAANKLYQSLGFVLIASGETNLYRLVFNRVPFPDEGDRRFSTSEHTVPEIPRLKTPPPEDR